MITVSRFLSVCFASGRPRCFGNCPSAGQQESGKQVMTERRLIPGREASASARSPQRIASCHASKNAKRFRLRATVEKRRASASPVELKRRSISPVMLESELK
jgi:hypothetical protein